VSSRAVTPSAAKAPSRLRTLALPLGVVAVGFLAFSLPPYLGLDPSQARLPVPVQFPWFYPALVAHIGFGSVALIAGTLQIWPWLRRTHPRVHRWVGRIYLGFGVFPGGLVVLGVAPFSASSGPNGQVANTMLALLWLVTGVAGYRAARARRFAEHREWMIRNLALTFSIIVNRVWGVVCLAVFVPEALGADFDRTGLSSGDVDPAAIAEAAGVSTWLSWVVNLLVAEWWLHHTRNRSARTAPAGERRRAVPVSS
jgi:hypothetical protein